MVVYLFALFLTIVLEGAVAYLLGLRQKRQLIALVIINVLTHNPELHHPYSRVLGYPKPNTLHYRHGNHHSSC